VAEGVARSRLDEVARLLDTAEGPRPLYSPDSEPGEDRSNGVIMHIFGFCKDNGARALFASAFVPPIFSGILALATYAQEAPKYRVDRSGRRKKLF